MELDKIYLGSCYELIKDIPDKSVDLIYTDIPYITEYRKNNMAFKGKYFYYCDLTNCTLIIYKNKQITSIERFYSPRFWLEAWEVENSWRELHEKKKTMSEIFKDASTQLKRNKNGKRL